MIIASRYIDCRLDGPPHSRKYASCHSPYSSLLLNASDPLILHKYHIIRASFCTQFDMTKPRNRKPPHRKKKKTNPQGMGGSLLFQAECSSSLGPDRKLPSVRTHKPTKLTIPSPHGQEAASQLPVVVWRQNLASWLL